MKNSSGRAIPNQFLIIDEGRGANGNFLTRTVFQSYQSAIAERIIWRDKTETRIDREKWDYSKTTGKYRNQFLGETKKETEKKIKAGIYVLTDLNNA